MGVGTAESQGVKPWLPPQADSLIQWATEAKVAFQLNTGDSVGGGNFKAYSTVGAMGRRLLRSLGRSGLPQAQAVEGMLDSLGLDTEITLDPTMPNFALLMVRNPYRRSANSIGFHYWYKGNDLRIQGAMYRGSIEPRMRVWWTGRPEHPYAWLVVDQERGETQRRHLKLLRLSPDGAYWDLVQWENNEPDMGDRARAAIADLDGDGSPEVVSWAPVRTDSLFEACPGCPEIIVERTFVERKGLYELHDSRVVPSSWATFQLFVRLLITGDRRGAARLVRDPARVDQALAAGWATTTRPGSWFMQGGDAGDRWPRWLEVRHRRPSGDQVYTIHFEQKEGRWIISDWIARTRASTPPSASTPGTSTPKPKAPPSGVVPQRKTK